MRILSRSFSSSRIVYARLQMTRIFFSQSFDEAARDFFLCIAVNSDSIPMSADRYSKCLVGLARLLLERVVPALKEGSCSALAHVAAQLSEGLAEQVGGVQSLVRTKPRLRRLPTVHRQVLPARGKRALLTLYRAPIAASESRVLTLLNLIRGVGQVTHDLELVEQNCPLQCGIVGPILKQPSNNHHCLPYTFGRPRAKRPKELRHAYLRAISASQPHRRAVHKIAHHDFECLASRKLMLSNAFRFSMRPRTERLGQNPSNAYAY